jgi:hypothetical protein
MDSALLSRELKAHAFPKDHNYVLQCYFNQMGLFAYIDNFSVTEFSIV